MHQSGRRERSPAPAIVIGVIVVAAAYTLGAWLRGSPPPDADFGQGAPVITIVEPADGSEVVGEGAALIFETSEPIGPTREGWGTGPYHIHLRIDEIELMPARGDIDELEPGRYRWAVPMPSGARVLRMHWSGPDHRPLPHGAATPVRVQVE